MFFNETAKLSLISDEMEKYCEKYTTEEPSFLYQLRKETEEKILFSQMLSGHLQGSFLSFIAAVSKPKRILEIGTFTGYGTLAMAQNLPYDARIDTIEFNIELKEIIQKYIDEADMGHMIHTHYGNAADIIPTLDHVYDLVFIDADKKSYARYYDMIFDKVASGGVLLADNLLWQGKVLGEENLDADTLAMKMFTEKVKEDPRVNNILLPFRDGLMLIYKK